MISGSDYESTAGPSASLLSEERCLAVGRFARSRCRVWCVRPQEDEKFREMCGNWYMAKNEGRIKSTNFQLHPPRGEDTNVFSNNEGTR